MSDTIGRIPVPSLVFSGLTFNPPGSRLVSDMGYGFSQDQPIITHRLGSADAKIEQRYLVGLGPRKFIFRKSNISFTDRAALATFWESIQGPYKTFIYRYPDESQNISNAIVTWENAPLSLEYLITACRTGITFVEVPGMVTNATWSSGFGTLSIGSHTVAPGDSMVVSGVTPSGYNGTVTVTAITRTTIIYAIASNPGAYVSGGLVTPNYTVSSTCTRFPNGTLNTALTDQVQEIIPLVHIKARDGAVPDIYVSDRRCIVGGQLYLPRILGIGEPSSDTVLSQDIKGSADNVQFQFANADYVMTRLSSDTDIKYATIELSYFHVNSLILLQLWSGNIQNFSVNKTGIFPVSASDGMFQIYQQYPNRLASRQCWKTFNDILHCNYAAFGSGGDPTSCDYYWNSTNGCLSHGMGNSFGGIPIFPQSVSVKDNSSGFLGYSRNTVTATSIVSDTIWGKPLADIWCNQGSGGPGYAFIANCLIAAVRDNGDFFDVLGIIGLGPLGGFTVNAQFSSAYFTTNSDGFTYIVGPMADGYFAQGFKLGSSGTSASHNTSLGLRQVPGYDIISTIGDQNYNQFGLLNIVGAPPSPQAFSPQLAFCELLYPKVSGFTPSPADSHSMTVPIAMGLTGYSWDASDVRTAIPGMINPFWVAINTFLRALGLGDASSATQLALIVRDSVFKGDGTGCAEIAATMVTPIVGSGTELQFQFQGSVDSRKPLRDWLVEILNTGLGFFTFEFGKLRLGCRYNASSVDTYGVGNILFQSLRLDPIEASFEHLIIDFADVLYQDQANLAEYQDKDHGAYYGRAGALLTAQMHSLGSPTVSQNLRIATVRTREELGGINIPEWRDARVATWTTTLLGLSNAVGQVVSITDPDVIPGLHGVCNVDGSGHVTFVSGDAFSTSMQNKDILINGITYAVTAIVGSSPVTYFTTTPTATTGSGVSFRIITMDFRIEKYQVRKDHSIQITGKTVTPSMYDLTVGPKPLDVLPLPPPVFIYPIPTGAAWCPYQVQYSSTDPLFPFEWTFDLDEEYVLVKNGDPYAIAKITGKQPTNQFSPGLYAPTIGSVAQSTTGGGIPGGSLIKITINCLDAAGLPSTSANIGVISVPVGTNTNRITLNGIVWPAVSGLTKYTLFASTMDDLIAAQIVGTLSGGGPTYTPTSIVLNNILPTTWALPNPYTKKIKLKAKHQIHGGVIGASVYSVSSHTIVSSDMVDTTGGPFTPVGRVLSIVGRPYAVTPLFSTVVTSWNPLTGSMGCTPDPSGIVLPGDTLLIRFLGSDNTSTPTQITDVGIQNQTSDAYAGFTAHAEIGNILRVIKGKGRGSLRKITENDATTLFWDTPLLLDATSVWIIEENIWSYSGEATDVSNADPLAIATFSIPIANFVNQALIFSVFTIDTNGVESNDGDQPIREDWVYGAQGTRTIFSSTSMIPTDGRIFCDTTSGNIIFTLLPRSQYPDQRVIIQKLTADTNTVTVTCFAGDTFPGGSTVVVLSDNLQNSTTELKL